MICPNCKHKDAVLTLIDDATGRNSFLVYCSICTFEQNVYKHLSEIVQDGYTLVLDKQIPQLFVHKDGKLIASVGFLENGFGEVKAEIGFIEDLPALEFVRYLITEIKIQVGSVSFGL